MPMPVEFSAPTLLKPSLSFLDFKKGVCFYRVLVDLAAICKYNHFGVSDPSVAG